MNDDAYVNLIDLSSNQLHHLSAVKELNACFELWKISCKSRVSWFEPGITV